MSYTSKGVRWYNKDQDPWLWMCEQLFVFDVFVHYDKEEMRRGLLTDDSISISQILAILYRLSKTSQTDDDDFKAFGYAWGTGVRRIGNNQFVVHMRWLVDQEVLIPHPDNGGKLRVTNKYILNLKWNADGGQVQRAMRFDGYKEGFAVPEKVVTYSRKDARSQSLPKVRLPVQKAGRVVPEHEATDSSVDFQSHDLGIKNDG